MENTDKITCGNCGHRLRFHYLYPDVKPNSKYVRCSMRPELKNRENSSPKWCPKKKIQEKMNMLSNMVDEL